MEINNILSFAISFWNFSFCSCSRKSNKALRVFKLGFCQKDNATEITATKMEIDNNSIKYSEN